jgi:putative membrane protein
MTFFADNFWDLAALLWISTGCYRALGGLEKGTSYYLNNSYFWLKMVLLLCIILLEILLMLTLMRWRRQLAQGVAPDLKAAPRLAAISYLQAGLTIVMVFAATAMARGLDF